MNQTELREIKTILRAYLRRYPLDRLCMLLAHAQADKLAFWSCCCLIGVETAGHALRAEEQGAFADPEHYRRALDIPGAHEAEQAYNYLSLGKCGFYHAEGGDAMRRRRIIPMIRAELRRRECEAAGANLATAMIRFFTEPIRVRFDEEPFSAT